MSNTQLTLNLSPKIKNSPTLAVKKFIHDHFLNFGKSNQVLTTQKLWNKFEMNKEYSTVIRKFEIDFLMFREIAEPILKTLQLNELQVLPVYKVNTQLNLQSYSGYVY